jgi:hypothetical protein
VSRRSFEAMTESRARMSGGSRADGGDVFMTQPAPHRADAPAHSYAGQRPAQAAPRDLLISEIPFGIGFACLHFVPALISSFQPPRIQKDAFRVECFRGLSRHSDRRMPLPASTLRPPLFLYPDT